MSFRARALVLCFALLSTAAIYAEDCEDALTVAGSGLSPRESVSVSRMSRKERLAWAHDNPVVAADRLSWNRIQIQDAADANN